MEPLKKLQFSVLKNLRGIVTSKYKLKLKDFKLQYIKDYIFPAFNIFRPKKKNKKH